MLLVLAPTCMSFLNFLLHFCASLPWGCPCSRPLLRDPNFSFLLSAFYLSLPTNARSHYSDSTRSPLYLPPITANPRQLKTVTFQFLQSEEQEPEHRLWSSSKLAPKTSNHPDRRRRGHFMPSQILISRWTSSSGLRSNAISSTTM